MMLDGGTTGLVILAAGHSSRMQSPKALLSFDKRFTFLSKLIATYLSWGVEEIVVVLNEELAQKYPVPREFQDNIRFVINKHVEKERFFSVKLGLNEILRSEYCFLQNIDNPFITWEDLDLIHKEKQAGTWVSPQFENKGGHPVLLSREVIDHIINLPQDEDNLKVILEAWPCKPAIMPDDNVLININDLLDFDKYFNLETE